jgi:hypothetical protein
MPVEGASRVPLPKLDRPPTKDGGTLLTIGEACDYMTSMGKKRELLSHWQRVAKYSLGIVEQRQLERPAKKVAAK